MEQADTLESLNRRKDIGPAGSLWDRAVQNLPGAPVLAETLLKLEFELHESATDLRGFSDAVLSDVGATIQILRLAGRNYGTTLDRPLRMEDCISDLGPQACLDAAAEGSLVRGVRQHASLPFWIHAKEVAQYFRLFAAQTSTSVHPDQAYLAGLLHALGALPSILQWNQSGIPAYPARAALGMAEAWHFPRFLRDFFSELVMPGNSPQWSNFITVAHHPAKESWAGCPLLVAPLPPRMATAGAKWY